MTTDSIVPLPDDLRQAWRMTQDEVLVIRRRKDRVRQRQDPAVR